MGLPWWSSWKDCPPPPPPPTKKKKKKPFTAIPKQKLDTIDRIKDRAVDEKMAICCLSTPNFLLSKSS